MVWREAFVDSLQEFVTNVCGDIDTVRWIEPDHVPISMAFRFRWLGVVLEVVIETAFFQSFLVWGSSRMEGSFV